MRIYVMISKVRSTEKSIINNMEETATWQKEVDFRRRNARKYE